MNESGCFCGQPALGAALLLGVCAGLFALGVGESSKPADDWRRTAYGWERANGWSDVARSASSVAQSGSSWQLPARAAGKGRRVDGHPAALALMQLVASMLALAAFSPRGRSLVRETSFAALLARSFRASVFGS